MDFEIDPEIKQKIEETVIEILNSVDMEETTEFKVRSMAADKLGLDLSVPERKRFVRHVVESFLMSKKETELQQEQEEQGDQQQDEGKQVEEAEEEEGVEGKKDRAREYDDEGDLIICRLSNKRRVTVQDFRGKTLVSIREYYEKDGKELPSSKGISLTAEQWEAFSKAVPKIEDAIKKMEEI